MGKRTDIVKPFEFSLKINNHIICQRFFSIKNYNSDSRESLEIKDMMSDIMGVNQELVLGLIPEFFKYQCIDNSYKPYSLQNNNLYNKDDEFILVISKNNVNKLKNKDGQFDIDDLKREVIASGSFDGNLFHPNVRYEIDIRGIIPDIINVISKYLSMRDYTHYYGDVKLTRNNRLSVRDLEMIQQD
tara:strand:+ start:35816 stop:36376 length:561 start_codon:yes stop_codon:yes gene_type:complete